MIQNFFEKKAEIEYWQNASYDEKLKMLEAIRYITYKPIYPGLKKIEKVVTIKKLGEE